MDNQNSSTRLLFGLAIFVGLMPLAFTFSQNGTQQLLETSLRYISNKEIAEKLFISLSTVKTYINNIYKILEVKNRREAIDKVNGK